MRNKEKLPDKEKSKAEVLQQELVIEEKIEEKQAVPEEVPLGIRKTKSFDREAWTPKTELGKKIKLNDITSINEILDKGSRIMEPEIVDALMPNLESDTIAIGQSKGKFGGGKRSLWRQTQKKTAEGNRPSFATLIVVGNRNGYVGMGYGKSKETVPAREKALRQAKLNLIKINRGCGSWECECASHHSIPFAVTGRCGSVRIKIMSAPRGTGLCIENESKKILALAGITDVYSKTYGQTRTKLNLAYACFEALKQLTKMKIQDQYIKKAGVIEGKA